MATTSLVFTKHLCPQDFQAVIKAYRKSFIAGPVLVMSGDVQNASQL